MLEHRNHSGIVILIPQKGKVVEEGPLQSSTRFVEPTQASHNAVVRAASKPTDWIHLVEQHREKIRIHIHLLDSFSQRDRAVRPCVVAKLSAGDQSLIHAIAFAEPSPGYSAWRHQMTETRGHAT